MRRLALLTSLLALGIAAPAAAWVELPFHPIPHDGVADCLRPAGPGRLALLGALGRRTSATDLFAVGPGGLARGATTTLGWLFVCANVGAAPGARPVIAGPVLSRRGSFRTTLSAADAGGAATALAPAGLTLEPPAVAVAPNGAAVVAWMQTPRLQVFSGARVMAATRPAGAARFGAPAILGRAPLFGAALAVGTDAAGHATVAWIDGGRAPRRHAASLLRIATTTDGERFDPTQTIASAAGGGLALAVAPNGRMLIADHASDSIVAYERLPGASSFTAVPVPSSGSSEEVALALADDGSAVIAYRSNPGPAFALLRRPGGAFGHEQQLASGPSEDASSSLSIGVQDTSRPLPPPDDGGRQIAAALDATGRIVVTWVDPGDGAGGASAHVARGTIAGGMAHATRLGSPCRTASGATPLALADGTLGAAWADNARVTSFDGDDTARGGGSLHVLLPGQASPRRAAAHPPGLAAQLAGSDSLRVGAPLHLRVRCRRGPCVVRAAATAYGVGDGPFGGTETALANGSTEVPGGHAAVLALPSDSGYTLARPRSMPATIRLLACAANGFGVTRLALHLRLRRVPPRPLPRILDLVARRHGRTIHVTWRTSIPARGVGFEVYVAGTADDFDFRQLAGRGRSRFSITFPEARGEHLRVAVVRASSNEQPNGKPVTTRIR